MSLIKSIRSQLGLSTTPANNFVLDASADNGTMKLSRGNAGATTQDIMTVDAAGKVAFPQNVQTWQDVKASRVLGTAYTNSTPLPIMVNVQLVQSGANVNISMIVNGAAVDNVTTNSTMYGKLSSIVPAGATYMVQSGAGVSVANWVELR